MFFLGIDIAKLYDGRGLAAPRWHLAIEKCRQHRGRPPRPARVGGAPRARGLAARAPGGDRDPTALRWPRPSMTPATASASSIRPRSKRSAGVACRGPKPIPPMRGSSPTSVAPRSRPRGPRCPGSCASCKGSALLARRPRGHAPAGAESPRGRPRQCGRLRLDRSI